MSDADGRITLTVTARAGDSSNLLCGGAANPDFDACAHGFSPADTYGAEVTFVVLDNGQAAENPDELAQQLEPARACPTCSPFTDQIAIAFSRESGSP